MAEESFSNEKVAKILNKYYISILVDKEQRPSIDKHFQNIYSILHKNGGGWPLVVLLTQNAKPFYLTTYVPRQSKHGYLGLIEILNYFVKLKKNDYAKILEVTNQISNILKTTRKIKFPKVIIGVNIIHNFIKKIEKRYDKDNPGIGISPKFPHANLINALLDIYQFNHNKKALFLATQMLNAMANGGIYDQLSGGFFRYTIDERWTRPHFEKMLYTNAQLLKDYIKAYKITKNPLYLHVINQTISFINRRFMSHFVYFSAIDADSLDVKNKLRDGAYYVYTYKEAKKILIKHKLKGYHNLLAYLGIFKNGNLKNNKNNIYINPLVMKPKGVKRAKALLLQIRQKRRYPFIDTKILTAWNAMYIQSLFLESSINPTILTLAKKTLNSLIKKVYIHNQLYHEKILTVEPTIRANFADYSFLISTLLSAYSVTYNKAYLSLADKLTKIAENRFYINKQWYLSLRPFKIKATLYGGAYASALSIMLDNLIKLAILKENLSYENLVKQNFQQNSLLLKKYPFFIPTAFIDYIKYKQGYIIIKAKLKALMKIRKDLRHVYPYILYKATQNSLYLACKVDKCFAYSHTKKGLIKKIKRYNLVR